MKGKIVSAVLLSGMFAATAGAQPGRDFSAIEITVHPVAENLYYLEGAGGNIAVQTSADAVLLVDTQFAPLSEKIAAAVAGLSDAPVRFIVNTHVHPDHTGGNENLSVGDARIVAHDNVRVRMAQGIRGGAPAPLAARPEITFRDELVLYPGSEVRLIKVPPAHTDGDTFVRFPQSNVIHLGDVFRTTGYPVIDVANGGTAAGTLAALQVAIDLSDAQTQIIPGHGELSSVSDVVEFRSMIQTVAERVTSMIEQGMTLEQVLAAPPTDDFAARFGDDPARFLTGLYESISAEKR